MSTPPRPKAAPRPIRHPVLTVLAADPARAFTVTDIAKALGGRSGGAVGAALARMVDDGHVTVTDAAPRRYQITATGRAAAATPAAPGPATGTTTPTTATSPGAVTAVPPRPGAVRRPNGDWYLPRQLADGTDVDILRRLRRDRIPVLLYGPPGTGKTSLVEAAFPDLITIAGHGDITVDDFVGSYHPDPAGGFTFTHGPLVTAMRDGRALLIDDATLISPKILSVLYPAMDGRATITIHAHHDETVTAAPGFYVIAGHNPGVHGAVLTEALASRFSLQIEVTTDFDLARTLGVPARAVTAAKTLNTKLAAGDIDWAPQLRELLAFKRISDTLGPAAAVANLAAIAPEPDRDTVIAALTTVFGAPITPLRVGAQITT